MRSHFLLVLHPEMLRLLQWAGAVSHRVSVLLIISRTPRFIRTIQHSVFEYE
jgi:hypothetical protein